MTHDTKSPTPAIPEAAIDMLCQAHYSFTGVVLETPHALGMLAAALPYLATPAPAITWDRIGGFIPEDYRYLAELMREHLNQDDFGAVLANNFNVILGALNLASATPAPADNGAGVRVKALEWREAGQLAAYSTPPIGATYAIQLHSPAWNERVQLTIREALQENTATRHFKTLDEAKAAAQADYEARIRSALVPATSVAEPGETLLTLNDLRQANMARQEHWGGSHNWTLADWSNALAGEVGEACNVVKKIRRPQLGTKGNDADLPAYHAQLESEIGDVLIYLDLLALKAGVTLDHCVSRAFNEKSEKLGMPILLASRTPSVHQAPVGDAERKSGKSKLVYDKMRRTIVAVHDDDRAAPVGETPVQEPVEWRYLLFGKGPWKHVYNQGAAKALLAENATLPKKRRHVVEPLYAAPVGEMSDAAFSTLDRVGDLTLKELLDKAARLDTIIDRCNRSGVTQVPAGTSRPDLEELRQLLGPYPTDSAAPERDKALEEQVKAALIVFKAGTGETLEADEAREIILNPRVTPHA